MSTSGVYGFHKNGVDKITYNNCDSYPSELGVDVVQFILNHSIAEMNEIFDNIELVNQKISPTPEQIQHCAPWTNLSVGEGSKSDWYCLLRNAQGDLDVYSKNCRSRLKYMTDHSDFLKSSLYCEWGYVINLTNNTLEVYKGFQEKPNSNRYSIDTSHNGYYSCDLIYYFDIEKISETSLLIIKHHIE